MRAADLTIFSGDENRIPLVAAANRARLRHTLVGASTLTVDLPDSLLTARLDTITHALAAGREWRFVAIKGLGEIDTVRLTFEDAQINALRGHRDRIMYQVPLPAAEIIRGFCAEAGVPVEIDELVGEAHVEGAGRSILDETDSWREIGALVDRLGGRVYSDGRRLVVTRDEVLLAASATEISPAAGSVTSKATFTLDTAQPRERAEARVDERWAVDAGGVVRMSGAGPADGLWIVETYARTIPTTATTGTVRLVRPRQIGR